jgi:hypothetical protein
MGAGCADGCPVTRKTPVRELSSVDEALGLGPEVEAISVSAEARPDLAGTHRWTVGASRSAQATHAVAAVVPLVPSGWTPADPVPLWVRVDARSGSGEASADAAIAELVAAVAAGPIEVRLSQRLEADVDMEGTNAFQIATRRALDEHGLHSPVGTPIATWPLAPGRLRWSP